MLNYPILNPDDVVIDPDRKRWKVQQVLTEKFQNYLISQRARLTLQPKSDQIYTINIP